MTGHDGGGALFRNPLPNGFSKRVYRAAPGRDVALAPVPPTDAILVVVHGTLEIECTAGGRRRFGRGALIPIAFIPVARLRSVGARTLVLAAVARSNDEFPVATGSHLDD